MTIFVGTKLQDISNSTTVGTANTYYTIHTFSTAGTTTFTPTGSGYVDVLVVGGGAPGGGQWNGGGGGGSVLYAKNVPILGGVSYPITVGGISGSSTFNYDGGNIVSPGGVAGGSGLSNPLGSGGGGAWSSPVPNSASGGIGANVIGLGFDGCPSNNGTGRGGGGGGAGGAAPPGGQGGVGLNYSIRGTSESFGGGGSGDQTPLNPNSSPTDFGLGGGAGGGRVGNPGCIIIRYLS
jgi:hypothetical protein